MIDEPHRSDRVEQALKDWGRRPPRTPASQAARRLVGMLRPRGSSAATVRWALATAIATLTVLAIVVGPRAPEHGPSPAPVVQQAPAPLPENVVQWWLDADTPVYFILRPQGEPIGGAS
jgi:hypothetical protein